MIIAFTFQNFRNKSDSINNLAQCLVHGRVVVTVILKDYIQMCMTSARKRNLLRLSESIYQGLAVKPIKR